jgi:hypothetical protein
VAMLSFSIDPGLNKTAENVGIMVNTEILQIYHTPNA